MKLAVTFDGVWEASLYGAAEKSLLNRASYGNLMMTYAVAL